MGEGTNSDQEMAWSLLYDRVRIELLRFGSEDYQASADCWVDDDNIGTRQQKVYVRNLNLLRPEVIAALRRVLFEFPAWEIMIAVSVGVRGKEWPPMGLTVRAHEIIDGLRRSYLPPELRQVHYEGGRPGTDGD